MNLLPSFVLQVLTIFLWSGTILSLFFGAFTWTRNKKSLINILFAFVSFSVAIWLGASVPMLNSCRVKEAAYFWDKVVYCGVVFIPIFLLHFSLVLGKEKNKIYKIIVPLGYVIATIFLFSIWFFPQFFIKGLFVYKWGCHSIAQPGHNYFLAYFVGYMLLFFYKIFRLWRTSRDPDIKTQSKYIFYSFLFLFASSLAFLPGYQIPVFPIAYVFPLIWILILTYAITQHNLLSAKVIIIDVLAALVIFTVLVYVMLSGGTEDIIVRLAFLSLIFFFASLAVRGVHREMNEKERLNAIVAERTKDLEQAKKVAEDRAAELERWYNATIGREVRMAELKEKIKELEKNNLEKN